MSQDNERRLPFRIAAALAFLTAACGGGKTPPDTSPLPDVTSPVVEQPEDTTPSDTVAERAPAEPGASAQPADTVLPNQRMGDTLPASLTRKRFDLNVPGESLKPVLRLLSHRSGVNFVIDPAVRGTVSVDLANVNTVEALDYILTPLEYGFEYERGAVWVKKQIFETRVFSLDYAITGREGQKTLTVGAGSIGGGGLGGGIGGGIGGAGALGGAGQGAGGGQQLAGGVGGRLSGSGLRVGGGGQFGAGTSTVISGSSASVFQDLTNGLQAIVFGSTREQQADDGGNGGAGRGGLASRLSSDTESRASSRTDSVGRQLIVNPFAGLIQITAEKSRMEQAANYIERVQGSVERQVLIEAEIVEVVLGEEDRFGIDWSAVLNSVSGSQSLFGPGQNQDFQVQVTDQDVDAVLRALSKRNELRTLASPRVSTLNNQKTVLQATTQEVFFSSVVSQPVVSDGTVVPSERQFVPQVVPVGVVVDVTPQISANGQIIIDIRPSVSEIKGVAKSPEGDTQPILDVRTIDTMARVRSGQTIVIGGLIQGREETDKSGVPLLSDVPVVGGLFSNVSQEDRRSQLVIFLTPHIQKGTRIDELTESQRRQLQQLMGGSGVQN